MIDVQSNELRRLGFFGKREIRHACLDAWHEVLVQSDEFVSTLLKSSSETWPCVSEYVFAVDLLEVEEPVGIGHHHQVINSCLKFIDNSVEVSLSFFTK